MSQQPILGVILAGGTSERMQVLQCEDNERVDKCLLPLAGEPLIQHVITGAESQVHRLIINSNRPASVFADYELPVVADPPPQPVGPLGGIQAAMQWALNARESYAWVMSFPGDSPFFPDHLVADLFHCAQKQNALCVSASYRDQLAPLFTLWSTALLENLTEQLASGHRQVKRFLAQLEYETVDYSHLEENPFFNINTPEDWRAAQTRLS